MGLYLQLYQDFSESLGRVLPDRASVGMDRQFLHSYSRMLIRTCHRRGAFAMGGMAAWLQGRGAVPTHHLMEDAATAEISRSQVWQWVRRPGGVLDDGRRIDLDLARTLLAEEQARIRGELGEPAYADGCYPLVGELLDRVAAAEELEDFLTLVAYDYLN